MVRHDGGLRGDKTASHLSDIGFNPMDQEEWKALVRHAAKSGEPLESRKGTHIRWSPGHGIELWVQVRLSKKKPELIGCVPHFSGTSRTRYGLEKMYHDPSIHTELDGSYHGYANPPGDDPRLGDYPLILDVPDFDLSWSRVVCPAIVEVQVAAFAHEVAFYPDEQAFDESQTEKPGFAAQSFIPSGTFLPGGGLVQPPKAEAIAAGRVLHEESLTNPETGRSFCHAKVETYGAELDVVADPEIVKGTPSPGGVAFGVFWLSGRIVGGAGFKSHRTEPAADVNRGFGRLFRGKG